jgi:hypothetical protein
LYTFGSGIEEFVEHIIEGVKLNSDLPPEQLVYDSIALHYMRLFILWMIGLFLLLLVVGCACIVCAVRVLNQPHGGFTVQR